MKKFQKVCLVFIILFSIAGIGCMAAALSMGASIPKRFTRFTRLHGFRVGGKVKKEYHFDKQQVRSMEIDIGSGTLQVVRGTGNDIILKNSNRDTGIHAEIKGDKILSIDQKSSYFWFFGIGSDKDAVLIIPEDMDVDELDIDVGSGNVSIEQISANETVIDCGSGEITVDQMKANGTEIDCGSGDVNITFAGLKQDYNYKIDCGSGDVVIDTEHFSGSEYSRGESGKKSIEIDCGSGDVTIDFLNQEDI